MTLEEQLAAIAAQVAAQDAKLAESLADWMAGRSPEPEPPLRVIAE